MDKVKKFGLFTLVAFCIGDTIGAGIFSTLPVGVSLIGPGVLYTWLAAIVMIIFVSIPSIIPSSSLPCPASSYTLQCRLLNPYVGYLEIVGILNYIMILALLSVFFADYVIILFPALGISNLAIAIGLIVLFWIVNLFGVEAGTKLQNVIVVVLMISLVCYVISGAPQAANGNITVSEMFAPSGFGFAAFCTVLAMFYTCLGGSFMGCLDLADRIKNPRRNLMLAGCLTSLTVGALFCAISIVTCGVADWQAGLPALGDIARSFMPTGLWYVFMIGGALCAMASTANAMVLSVGYRISTMATDKIFPEAFNKTCRYGTKPLSLSVAPVIAILIVLLDLPLGSTMAACSVLAILSGILRLLPLLVLPKRYPHTYRRSLLPLPKAVTYAWVITAVILCVVVSISTILETAGPVWVLTFGLLAAMYVYFLIRVRYMKAKNVDVFAIMSTPYLEWEDKEEFYRNEDKGSIPPIPVTE